MPRPAALVVLVTALGLLLTGCGGTPTPAVTVTAAAPAPTVTVSETAAPVPPTAVEEATSSTEPVAPETFTMPKLTGKNLQLAQDILQNEGSFLMDQTDALGLHRVQVNDSNWKVCTQSPKAGKKVSVDAMVTLAAVKLDEDCP